MIKGIQRPAARSSMATAGTIHRRRLQNRLLFALTPRVLACAPAPLTDATGAVKPRRSDGAARDGTHRAYRDGGGRGVSSRCTNGRSDHRGCTSAMRACNRESTSPQANGRRRAVGGLTEQTRNRAPGVGSRQWVDGANGGGPNAREAGLLMRAPKKSAIRNLQPVACSL